MQFENEARQSNGRGTGGETDDAPTDKGVLDAEDVLRKHRQVKSGRR